MQLSTCAQELGQVDSIWKWPVKGFGGVRLPEVLISQRQGIQEDRKWAITSGYVAYDAQRSTNPPKAFLCLKNNPQLASFKVSIQSDAVVSITAADGQVITLEANHPPDDATYTALSSWFGFRSGYRPCLVVTDDLPYFDDPGATISIINLASVSDLQQRSGRLGVVPPDTDMLRFRANLCLNSMEAYGERELVGRRFWIGSVLFQGLKRTERCRATEVNPITGEVDWQVVRLLRSQFGHFEFGIYAQVLKAGKITAGDALILAAD